MLFQYLDPILNTESQADVNKSCGDIFNSDDSKL